MNKSLLEIKILFTTKLFHGSWIEPNHQVKSDTKLHRRISIYVYMRLILMLGFIIS